jgi:hypothetical protein
LNKKSRGDPGIVFLPDAGANPKPFFDAAEYLFQMGLSHAVKHLSSVFFAGKKTAPLHQAEMFRRHCTRQTTRFRKFTHRKITLQQHLDHSQPMRVSQRPQTLSRFAQRFQFSQFQFRCGHVHLPP